MKTRVTVITGLSGSGKSTAAKCFEDAGYYCVDNLPPQLIERLIHKRAELVPERNKIAVVADVRSPGFLKEFPKALDRLEDVVVIFFEASDEILVRRFSETRRPHPLARDRTVIEGIRHERELLAALRARADLVIDTGEWSVHDLRQHVFREYSILDGEGLVVAVTSFGYKFGIPKGADLLFDVRFLPNPHFVPELRELTGTDKPIRDFLENEEEYGELCKRLEDFLLYVLPRYQRENRSYLTVAVGCTGGRHRSVATAEWLADSLREHDWSVQLSHRDVARKERQS